MGLKIFHAFIDLIGIVTFIFMVAVWADVLSSTH